MKKILVLNTGSTSIKYKLFQLAGNDLVEIKQGEIGGIGLSDGPKNHQVALTLLFEGFGVHAGALYKIEDLIAIVHRVVHGASEFTHPIRITDGFIKKIKKYDSLAPLHNPPAIKVIETAVGSSGQGGHRTIDNYAVFDTAYYTDLPDETKYYPLPIELQEKHAIRRYGFHGLSHKNSFEYISINHPSAKKIISMHLGAGCSMTAILNGKPIDTSMGFTPLEGLMMGTRSGDIDPGIILYLLSKKYTVKEITNLLSEQAGLKAISETTSDMKDILFLAGYSVEDVDYRPKAALINLPDLSRQKAKLALSMFIYRIKKYIGSYVAILNGLDVLSFTGNIGVDSSLIRKMVIKDLDYVIKDAKIIVVPTDEEYQIAKEILPLINKET